ncbi:Rieske 2Fe-2S domain-containing protein [Streptomyces sp. S.PB5]|uniref:aromatic ring-hydroxylating oxygenase subunit alpha n=1 Tax=Streptomyces sp. S.PB5 TaxID=3020844 RepID=UPI0025B0A94E|nr:Rieske 2Fe-2S domain-containing protein [Streptomyces sp. S.PB5]MDN3028102.1 Rieske 2Fe-2S domain-containing protein [Streptomyces sp. S.PB5]
MTTHPAVPADLVQEDRVAGHLYTDPKIFERELDRIFENTWIWVAHDSELPKPGSFKTAFVGRHPVVVTRDRKGTVRTLLNRCRHRGASVCEKKQGEANGFTCPYHAWSYGLDGRLRGIPYPDGYEGVVDKKDFALKSLRTESYGGLVFATMNDGIETLEDFLADARMWIDRFMKQGGGFPVKVLGKHRFKFHGNWKIQLENTTDGYHFPIVHRSWMASVDAETADMMSFMTDPECTTHDLGNGHSVMQMVPEHSDLDADDGTEELQERFSHIVAALRAQGMDDASIRKLVRAMHGTGFNLNLFPNVSMSSAFFRVLRPVAVDETHIEHVALGADGGEEWAEAVDVVNRERLRIHEHFQGPFGFGTPDDAEGWDRVQRGTAADPDLPIMINRGLAREKTSPEGWKTSHVTDETGMRAAYAKWKQMMSDD